MDANEDLVKIESGRAEAVGAAALLRLQARQGLFHMLPAPAQLVVMREHPPAGSEDADVRALRLSGEITGPGDLCDVFGLISQAGWCGEVIVFDDEGTRSLYVERGDLVGAASTVHSERLGQVLYRYGVLTQEQVNECLATAATGMWFGEAAVKLGLVRRERLFELMGRQAQEIFFGSLLARNGMVYVLDTFDETALSSRHVLPIASLVREGIRRMHEGRAFRSRIPSKEHVPVPIAPRPPPPDADPHGLYAMLDGQRSVADLCRALGEPDFVVIRSLFQMLHQGYVAMRPPRRDPRQIVTLCGEAIAMVLRELDALDQGDDVRAQLAEFVGRGSLAQLFAGAGPSDDGTFDPARVVENLRALADASTAEQQLATWLREYAAYALFLARPHLRRAQQARAGSGATRGSRLSERVGALLAALTGDDDGAGTKGQA